MTKITTSEPFRNTVRESDESAVRAIVGATGFFRDDEARIAAELVRERFERGAASGYEFLFADTPERTIAYACFGPIGCTVGSYDLYWIAVDPSAQGAGLGRRLLDAVGARVKAGGGRRIYAETSGTPRYEPTRRFYLATGFTVVADIPDFYSPGDNKVIFCKSLDPAAHGPR